MTPMASGYSSTPLTKKLGIKSGDKTFLHNTPKNYLTLFSNFPTDTEDLTEIKRETADFMHIFCTSTVELEEVAKIYKQILKKSGMLWISWPKRGSPIVSNLNRDFIREYMLNNGLVDVKVAAVDEDWSALKFVYRLKDR